MAGDATASPDTLSLNNFLRFFSDRCENILENKLLSKENLIREQENAQKQNNLSKLRELCVVLQKIDEASKKRPIKIDKPLKKRCKKNLNKINGVLKDNYSYLNDNSAEDIPFHTVNWNNLESNESTSQEKSSEDICTVCFVNVRTHAFTPCGHLACCFPCIKRLEANRCPICNVIYENYIRIRKP